MDDRLRRVEREGRPSERYHARRRAGASIDEALDGLVGRDTPYDDVVALVRELEPFRFLRRATYRCGEVEARIASFAHSRSGLTFQLIPGGRFLMGSTDTTLHDDDELPQHLVEVPAFLLARTPCTQAAWDELAEAAQLEDDRSFQGDELPMEGISWLEATRWCKEAGLRLPTEAEWEYAGRAGTSGAFHFPDDEPLTQYAWLRENAGDSPAPVGKLAPNAWGLHDMLGNVWEWCQDTYQVTYRGAPNDGSAWEERKSERRVYRGGSWRGVSPTYVRIADRFGFSSKRRIDYLGFRPAFSVGGYGR